MINKIKDKLFDIKCFIQRGREGYSDKDLWDFDCYLAKVISNGLQRLKEKGLTSYPPEFVSKKEWENILDTIIEGFKEKLKACNCYTYDFEKVNKALELLAKYFNYFWD
jgi:site-specific DNA-adenine methylase